MKENSGWISHREITRRRFLSARKALIPGTGKIEWFSGCL